MENPQNDRPLTWVEILEARVKWLNDVNRRQDQRVKRLDEENTHLRKALGITKATRLRFKKHDMENLFGGFCVSKASRAAIEKLKRECGCPHN